MVGVARIGGMSGVWLEVVEGSGSEFENKMKLLWDSMNVARCARRARRARCARRARRARRASRCGVKRVT